ncbi:MAG: choice-of-anchor L domain-containing protein, partial [Bacteroidota bacterium]
NYNGQTVVLTAHAEVTAGVTYHIKLVIADQGDTLFDSAIFLEGGSFTTIASLGNDRLVAAGNPLCIDEVLTVNAASAGATGYQWYKYTMAIAGETS